MQYLILTILLAWLPWPAAAVCPGHSNAIVAGANGSFRLCPKEVDADGATVPTTGYYASCEVKAVWGDAQTTTVTLPTPTPGTPVLVSFPAARGVGGATGTCTSTAAYGGLTGAVSASAITFRPVAAPASPVLAQ